MSTTQSLSLGRLLNRVAAGLAAIPGWADRHERALFWSLIVTSTIFLLAVKLGQHYSYRTGAFDLSMFDTAIYNTLDGRFLYSEQLGRNFFSEHFMPILLLLAPVYLVANASVTLLIIQALGLVGAVSVLYAICREYGLATLLSLLCGLLLLSHRTTASGFRFDFHPEMLEPAFLLGAILFALRRRVGLYWLSLLLAFACKEDVPIYGACLGLYVAVALKQRWTGGLTVLVAIVWALLAWTIIIPGAMGDGATQSAFLVRWGHLGTSYLDIGLELATSPLYVLSRLASFGPVTMLASLAFVPLLGFEVLLVAIPGTVLNVTSAFESQSRLDYYYGAPMLPFVLWAFVVGLRRLQDWTTRLGWLRATSGVSMIPIVLCAILVASGVRHYEFHTIDDHALATRRMVSLLPEGQVVAAQTGFIPHISRRSALTILFPEHPQIGKRAEDANFIMLDLKEMFSWPISREELVQRAEALRADEGTWRLVFDEDGLLLFERIQKLPVDAIP